MTIRTYCRLVLAGSYIVAIPALAALLIAGVPVWAVMVSSLCFWMSGQLFVIAMIGDGKEGLGIKRK